MDDKYEAKPTALDTLECVSSECPQLLKKGNITNTAPGELKQYSFLFFSIFLSAFELSNFKAQSHLFCIANCDIIEEFFYSNGKMIRSIFI